MKSTKVLAVLLLLFISSTICAQKVHYKDSYYTIVKSKIFHRGHDVYGQLTPGKIDTIHTIAKELYNEKGKLKDKYKKRKKRDRYKLPEGFWEQKSGAIAKASITESRPEPSEETIVAETTASTTNTISKITEEKVAKEVQKAAITAPKKVEKEGKVVNLEDEKRRKAQKKEVDNSNESTSEIKKKEYKKEEKSANEKEKKVVLKEKVAKDEKEIANEKSKNNGAKQLKKEEKKILEEKRERKKSTERIEKQQSREAKKIENIKKEKDAQLKKQKSITAKEAALTSVSAVSTSVSKNETFGTIYIKVNKEKTSTTKSGAVLLFFEVINNSNKDLVILKPNNSMDNRLDFFSNTMECADIPIRSTDYLAKDLKIKNEDFMTIPANAKIELFINGTYRNWLACSSEDIILQIQYNPFKSSEEDTELQPALKKEISKSLKRITPIKIESENIKFKLNKQE